MRTNPLDERLRNLFLILMLLIVTVFTAYNEGYLSDKYTGNNALLYWATILGGALFGVWLSMTISTKRLVALMFATFVIEYIKETVGIRTGLWMYTGNHGGYLLGVWTWVWGGVTIYCIASKVAVRLTMKNPVTGPRFLNPILIVALFSVLALFCPNLPFCLEDVFEWWPKVDENTGAILFDTGKWVTIFWAFYVTLMFISIIASLFADIRALFGIVISVLIIGYIGEIAGASAEIWQYIIGQDKGDCLLSSVPQFYLLLGCLPLEVISQFAISALLAGEALVLVPPMNQDDKSNEPDPDKDNDPDNKKATEFNGESDAEKPSASEETFDEPTEKDNESSDKNSNTRPDPMQFGLDDEGNVEGDDVPLTLGEKRLAAWLRISSILYLLVGLGFFIFHKQIMDLLNYIALFPDKENPWFNLVTLDFSMEQTFWLSMTVSMMMCITFLAFYAQYNIRKNKLYTIPLLIAKFTSSFSGLMFFVFYQKYFCLFAVFVVDGFLFWFTLQFYVKANMEFLKQQTAYFRKKIKHAKESGPTKVVVSKGTNKFQLLEQVLEETNFYQILEDKFNVVHADTGVSREKFSIAIKPNFMFMHAKEDYSTYTDPELVEHLINGIWDKGFRNINVVEAQSTLGNYYENRDVLNVAKVIGYSTNKNYNIVDLTKEKVRYDYGGRLGWHWVGPTWRDADFRISFAKNKTHTFCGYTLTLKNVYGAFPIQNKFKQYHVKWEYDWPTIESLRERNCPVHFGLVDAFYSADGQFGVMTDPDPNFTGTIFGGENLIAVDHVGAKKMGLNPEDINVGRFYYLAVREFGRPEVIWIGDKSKYEPWENVSQLIIQTLDLFEETYHFGNWWFSVLSANDENFPLKPQTATVNFLRWVFKPLKATLYTHDVL